MKNNNIAVVIPSYNEVENLSILIKGIRRELSGAWIIIVDDSKAEENKKLKRIVKNYTNITLISRLKKSGRGSAVIDGFKEAFKKKTIQYVFEMDSDLAHDPKEMKRFLEKNKSDKYDLIIGSRYLPGGKIINISADRTILSRIINKFLYHWLAIHLTDHTSGFRFYKRRSIEYLINANIKATGFIALSEIAYKLFKKGYKIAEVPITWNYRIYGKSTVNSMELLNSLSFIISMRLEETFLRKVNFKKIIAIFAIFILAFSIRIIDLNKMGRAWDELLYIYQGYKMDKLLLKGDFSNPFFYTTYDHPPLVKYIDGIPAQLDFKQLDTKGEPVFNYDFTYTRLVSIVFACLAAVMVLIIAWEYISPFAGVLSGIIFSTLPFFVGLSQLASTESILMFFFTTSVYSFIKLFEKFSIKRVLIAGILTGFTLETKQSNALLFPILFLFYITWYFKNKNLKESFFGKRLKGIIALGIIAGVVFVALWPMPYFHLDVINQINQRIWLVKTSPPVIFWGRLMFAPKIYFITLYFITTPLLILLLSFIGLKKIEQKKSWVLYGLIIWFLFPFMQSFYIWRAHGVRYIIEIYAPLSIIASLGIIYIVDKLGLKLKGKILVTIAITTYMLWALSNVRPYYLDYFNILVGGPKGIYEKRYFELGWWGQSLREAGYYLRDHGKKDSTVGLYVSPLHDFPPVDNLKLVPIDPKNPYNPKIKYDYIVVNYYHILREGFDDSGIRTDYKLIYEVKVDGGVLVYVYAKR